ncbi:hypothetical protein [Salinicola aestuarinus]|uniref:hypothetical protein n=1 Tax=Salinicola aestuarinus TaxID=1949082 RepID=UPI000DA232E0|nr:hypothetical protein [Salinicola aestuarinus]
MKKRLALGLLLLSGAQITGVQAQECTTEALVQANHRFQEQIVSYGQAHSEDPDTAMQNMKQAMEEAHVESTLKAHEDEFQTLEPGSGNKPSQALCDDVFQMFDDFDAKVAELD